MKTNKIQKYQAALKLGAIPLTLKRTKGGWAAFLPAKISATGGAEQVSDVKLPWVMPVRELRLLLASRYGIQVSVDSTRVWLNTRHAMKLPNWTSPYGALAEVSNYMLQAGLISQ